MLGPKKENYLITGKIVGAKMRKGVRAALYRLASNHLGFKDGDNVPFWYDGNDLNIRLLFESKKNCENFKRLVNESLVHNSAIDHTQIFGVTMSPTETNVGESVFATDYNPNDFDSPQDAISMVSGSVSILDSSRPIFQFQRIESDSVFGKHYKAESCHLISKSYYRQTDDNDDIDDVDNNRLALSSDVHNWFDGKKVDVPLVFKLTIHPEIPISRGSISQMQNRYEVTLKVTVLDSDSGRLLFHRLKEGSEKISELEATVKVYVLNPEIFKKCIEWKAKMIQMGSLL
jgi:hypothetical protein